MSQWMPLGLNIPEIVVQWIFTFSPPFFTVGRRFLWWFSCFGNNTVQFWTPLSTERTSEMIQITVHL